MNDLIEHESEHARGRCECPCLDRALNAEAEVEGLEAERAGDDMAIESLRTVKNDAIAHLTVLIEVFDGECRFDHNDFCQQHYFASPCEVAKTRNFLSVYCLAAK
jgi:hypothetical protein